MKGTVSEFTREYCKTLERLLLPNRTKALCIIYLHFDSKNYYNLHLWVLTFAVTKRLNDKM